MGAGNIAPASTSKVNSMKIFLLFGIYLLIWLISAPMNNTADQANNISLIIPAADHPKMWVGSAILYKGDTFCLHFTPPNATYLGIVDPKGHFFYLVYPTPTDTSGVHPIMGSNVFTACTSLKMNTASLQADPYIYDININRPVFTISGDYTFILGENLHVDDPLLLVQARVHYRHTSH